MTAGIVLVNSPAINNINITNNSWLDMEPICMIRPVFFERIGVKNELLLIINSIPRPIPVLVMILDSNNNI